MDVMTGYVPQGQVKSTQEGQREKLGLKKGIRGRDQSNFPEGSLVMAIKGPDG